MTTKKELAETRVADVMTRRVETLSPVDTIRDAVNMMMDCKLTTVPVVDGNNRCVGILSRSDLTEMFLQGDSELSHVLDTDRLSMEWLNRSLDTSDVRKVNELMSIDVATVQSSQTLAEACLEMKRHQIHHLPVVNEQEAIVGIVSAFDVVTAIAEA